MTGMYSLYSFKTHTVSTENILLATYLEPDAQIFSHALEEYNTCRQSNAENYFVHVSICPRSFQPGFYAQVKLNAFFRFNTVYTHNS